MDKMVEKLLREEAELRSKDTREESEDIVLSPKINVEELLRTGAVTLEDYKKSH